MSVHPPHPDEQTKATNNRDTDQREPQKPSYMRCFCRDHKECALTKKVSDGSQPPMTFDLSLSESARSRSLHRVVGHPRSRVRSSGFSAERASTALVTKVRRGSSVFTLLPQFAARCPDCRGSCNHRGRTAPGHRIWLT